MTDSSVQLARVGHSHAHSNTPAQQWPEPATTTSSPQTEELVVLAAPTATTPALAVAPAAAPARGTPARTFRQRSTAVVRRVVGLSLVTAALWWLMLPLVFPVTSEAVVNARTVQVRAPIDGTASELTFDVGDPITPGQPMARLVNRHLDTSGLTGLTARQAELVTRRERLEKELDEVVRNGALCRAEAERYRDAVVANLEASLKETESKARSGKVEHDTAARRLDRVTKMSRGGLSDTEMDAARESESVCRIRLDTDQATLAKSRAELGAAKQGLFLQKDSPHFQQRADELALRVPTLKAALKEAADLLAGVEAEIARERTRTERLAEATAEAPVGGTVWVRQGNRGQGVKQNEVLYEIADGNTVFVEAVVHQGYLGAVTAGTPAVVNVTGGPSLSGRVRAVRSGRAGDNEPTFAFGASDPDPKKLRVVIDLDPGVADPAALIGRHVRVLVADREAGPCHQAIVWLFSNARFR